MILICICYNMSSSLCFRSVLQGALCRLQLQSVTSSQPGLDRALEDDATTRTRRRRGHHSTDVGTAQDSYGLHKPGSLGFLFYLYPYPHIMYI